MTIAPDDYSRYIDEMLVIERKMRHLTEEELKEIPQPELRDKLNEIHGEENEHIRTLEGIKKEILSFNKKD